MHLVKKYITTTKETLGKQVRNTVTSTECEQENKNNIISPTTLINNNSNENNILSGNINKQRIRHPPIMETKYLYAFTLKDSKDWEIGPGIKTIKAEVGT